MWCDPTSINISPNPIKYCPVYLAQYIFVFSGHLSLRLWRGVCDRHEGQHRRWQVKKVGVWQVKKAGVCPMRTASRSRRFFNPRILNFNNCRRFQIKYEIKCSASHSYKSCALCGLLSLWFQFENYFCIHLNVFRQHACFGILCSDGQEHCFILPWLLGTCL